MSDRHGFTLIELSVALALAGLVIASVLPLAGLLRERAQWQETRRSLDLALGALQGFAAVHGRLPCPATAASAGREDPEGGGNCSAASGFLPAVSLGLLPVDADGYALDAWGGRLRYAVATQTTANPECGGGTRMVFTTADCMRAVALPHLAPNLSVCTNAACTTSLVASTPAVVHSTGRNYAGGGQGADERENPNPASTLLHDPNPLRFVSHEPTGTASAAGEFDDVVVWLSPFILYDRMIAAGRLP